MAGIPQAALACVGIEVFPQELCIPMPGGVDICVQFPDLGFPQPLELVKQLMAQFNAALTPLAPLFNILDVALTIVNCVKGIPSGPTEIPPFKTLIGCIPDLIKKAAKLAAIIPPLSIPFTILGILDATLVLLNGIVIFLQGLADEVNRIEAAVARATSINSHTLTLIVECARADLTAQMANFNESLKPLNLLLGLVNAFIGFIPGVPQIPTSLSNLGVNPSEALDPIRSFIHDVTIIRHQIPV